ncbi:centrosomal protein of 78 kDa isoform X1 [Patella vulgata]|uniref:centrosomal protein of 78 kDa isoform X1 n=2 Tax=Patella vulgata TaxID=6465 RepID=UPI00217FE3B9|nr:centrosomal protein of 78 kDa isoform X1 [Patella vulgata]
MIQSVQERQRGAYDFESHYDNLCALQDSAPLSAVKAHLSQGVLDISGDRIRANDWKPILDTLQINKSLEFVAVRSSFMEPKENQGDVKTSAQKKQKTPAIRSREITYRLCKALQECLSKSPQLSCLELQGLPMRQRDINCLVKGLAKSTHLKHLSMEQCLIGDKGLEMVCKAVKQAVNINSVNFSACNLSSNGAESIVSVIKHQAMKRHSEAWGDSLRYRRPDLDRMPGIRRITLNDNSLIGDQGAMALAEALKDDLWLKALDLQSCGISNPGARALLDVLEYNTTIVVLDVRKNVLIERDVIHAIMEQLMLNSKGQDTEYKWLKTEESPDPKRKPRRRATRLLNSSFGRKLTQKAQSSVKKITISAENVDKVRSKGKVSKSPGLPWRTAERADRYRGFPPDYKSSFIDSSECLSPNTTTHNHSISEIVLIRDNNYSYKHNVTFNNDSDVSIDINNPKEVKVELEQLRRSLREEKIARATSDQALLQLAVENKRLQEDVTRLKRLETLGDESFLSNVEASFKQFHQFLDMLTEANLGNLITMAGLDNNQLPFMQTSFCMPSVFGPNSTLLQNSHLNQTNGSTNWRDMSPIKHNVSKADGDTNCDIQDQNSPVNKHPVAKTALYINSPEMGGNSTYSSPQPIDSGDDDF